jgi:hypothetical protein
MVGVWIDPVTAQVIMTLLASWGIKDLSVAATSTVRA